MTEEIKKEEIEEVEKVEKIAETEEEKDEPKPLALKILNVVLQLMGFFGIPFMLFYLTNSYLFDPAEFLNRDKTIVNYLFFAFILWIVFLLVGRFRIASIITTVFFMVFGLCDYYVYNFRGNPILPWDFNSIGVAASVADNYDYTLEKRIWRIIIGFLVLILIELFIEIKLKFNIKHVAGRIVGVMVLCLCIRGLVLWLGVPANMTKLECYPFLFQQDVMTKRNGLMLTFMYDFNFIKVDKPKGYSEKKAQKILEDYEYNDNYIKCNDNGKTVTSLDRESNDYAAKGTPDVIVIMNESFSDLSVLGDFETNEDYMPFIHELMAGYDDTVSGYLDVSIIGGNTPNSEYEFLTGNTLKFLPIGSIPFQQYMFDEKESLVSQLNNLGYETTAMHPYYAKGWNRYNVYDYFGFDDVYFNDRVTGTKVRNYFSDDSLVDWIINKSEEAGDDPILTYTVTMQNHSSFSEVYDNLPQNIKVKGLENNNSVSNYFSLMKLSDDAVKKLINYYKTFDRDTVIVFFGDHQPNTTVSYPILRMNGIDPDNLTAEENALRYKVPYFIWANFDIEEETDKEISANYLSELMVDKVGIEKTPYQNFLKELQKDYPVISAAGVWDYTYAPVGKYESKDLIKKYNIIQYYKMFDE